MTLERVIAVRNHKTVFRDGDNCYKVFDKTYTKANVMNEALNQGRVEETGLNIPEIREITQINGNWAIVSRFIEGKTIARLMEEHPEKKREYMEMFVELQNKVNSKTCPRLSRLSDRMNMRIIQCELDATTRYDLHNRLNSMPRQSFVCHGDFVPSNIIISDDGEPYILDWSHATQGNPAADAARTYLLFWLEGNISGAKLYLDTYCEKSGANRKFVEAWMPIVAASQSIDCSDKQREFLLSWVKAVNHEE